MDEFKLIVAGSRDFNNYPLLSENLHRLADVDYADKAISIVSGMARGADSLAVEFAIENNVKLYEYPADWATYGKRAGFLRNEKMAQHADGLLAFWDGQSRGTEHMIRIARDYGLDVYVVRYTPIIQPN